jgi:hypothetical protein
VLRCSSGIMEEGAISGTAKGLERWVMYKVGMIDYSVRDCILRRST